MRLRVKAIKVGGVEVWNSDRMVATSVPVSCPEFLPDGRPMYMQIRFEKTRKLKEAKV